jgi:hypothetical protein
MFGGAACLVATIPGQASADPPGNNGTVKVDGLDFDDHPNNQPHVGCTFQIDFYGYDEGDLNATVTFEDHAPTADAGLTVTSGQGNPSTVFIGEDDNSGGGSEAGLDASETYTLAFSGEPHPVQGFHVKLTINAEGSQGADVKHKVFWVTGCAPSPTTTTKPGETTTTTTKPGETTTTTKPGETTTTKPGASSTSGATSSSGETTTTAAAGGSSTTAPGGGGDGELPFTGAGGALPLLAVGLALVGLGAASLLAKARRGA